MHSDRGDISLAELELAVLRTLCADPSGLHLNQLASYKWGDEEHRVVFECLLAASRNRAVPLQEEMAAQATRMGHPEVDWDLYFGKSSPLRQTLEQMVRRLKSKAVDAT
jgi:hypothetical protein